MERLTRISLGTRSAWSPRRTTFIRRNRSCIPRARQSEDDGELEDAEDRIARLEAAAKGRPLSSSDSPVPDAPIAPQKTGKKGDRPGDWKDMSTGQKAWELYAGDRGALFWANRVALIAAIVMGVGWVVFRFVGPQLGLYELKSTFSS